ncbi:hypothetical protein EB796_025111 [Bugula neritina]|uniref:Neurotransmitter-gated ion-channel ligand-binding domain-containing protein n=1 Tax=Bugula neritina TaxID=10212 RepID=A0A7J7IRR4_BUGNE|nr:hypothetical protein EB796_025111 [Bugula neritina]
MSADIIEALKRNPVANILRQIEQNTRSEKTAVLYESRKERGANKVQVKIRALVYAITDIDNEKQEFTANLSVRARWKEPLLQGLTSKSDIDWDDQWNPRIELENAVSIRNFDKKYEISYFHTDLGDNIPHVCLTMNISATFKEMFELDEFPLDYQALNIWLISEWSYSELDLVKDDEYMDRLAVNTFTESKEWFLYPQLIGEPVGEEEEIDEVSGSTSQYPLYTITAQVKRIHQFYMWNHVLYMFMIFLVGLSTFSIPVADVGLRISGALLVLLCALIYRLYMRPMLPVIAYWTALDKYNMSIMLCHILILLEHSVVGGVANTGSMPSVTSVDLACLGGIVAVMVTIHCYFLAFMIQTLNKRDKFLQEEATNFEELNATIKKNHETRTNPRKRFYEPPPLTEPQPPLGHPGVPYSLNKYYISPNGQSSASPRPTPRPTYPPSPRLQRDISFTRNTMQRSSDRGAQPILRASSPLRAAGYDHMNPVEKTHEAKITVPTSVMQAVQSRSRSHSRSRGRSRSRIGNNRVAAESSYASD